MDILQLIEELEDLIDHAGSVPRTKEVMVAADEVTEILHEMRATLPAAIREASVITEDRQSILDEARRNAESTRQSALADADRIRNEAQQQMQRLVNEHDITRNAETLSKDIVAKAEQNARNVTLQATTYIDDMFGSTQERLREMLTAIEDSRNELRRSK